MTDEMELAPITNQGNVSLFLNVKAFEQAQRVAKMLSTCDILPKAFKGKIGNILIALNFANRINADPVMVMQNMGVIHGNLGLEGKLVTALINASGKFSPLRFKEDEGLTGTGKPDEIGVLAYAKDLKSGEVLDGPKVTWKMVKAEGWDKDTKYKDGSGVQKSKWNTIPQVMFRYRAASFFGRSYCPEVTMGMLTKEELTDVGPIDVTPTEAKAKELTEKLKEPEKLHPDKLKVDMATGEVFAPFDPPTDAELGKEREYQYNDKGNREPVEETPQAPLGQFESRPFKEKLNFFREILGDEAVNTVAGDHDLDKLKPHEQEAMLSVLKAQADLEAAKQEAK